MNAFRPALAGRKPSKYRNVPITVDGIFFPSKREARRWGELKLQERAKYITDLARQVKYRLEVNGQLVAIYIADFEYRRNGVLVTEDSKGVRTKDYIIKAKLMCAIHGITVIEV